MKIKIITVSKRIPDWISKGYNEYIKRLPKEIDINLVEISPESRKNTPSIDQILRKEAKKILTAIPEDNYVIALDENGKQFNSSILASYLAQWLVDAQDICFIIGGADGLDDSLKKSAHALWSLSPMTLPHAFVRLIVAEQIYRAWSINNNHPYHRE